MDYGTGKTLSLIALVFIIIELVGAVITGMLYLFQGIFVGAMVFSGGDSSTGALCMAVSIIFVLIIIAIPAMKMKWGLGIYKSFKNGALTSDDKPMLIALVVLCLITGGWIAGVLYIVILASWKDLKGGALPQSPGISYQSQTTVRNRYSAGAGLDTPSPPNEATPPPGYGSTQQYPDELNW